MPDLLDGLTDGTDGVASDNPSSFEHGLAAAAAQARESDPGGTPAPTAGDPQSDSALDIARSLLDPSTGSATVADGISVKDDSPAVPAPTEVQLGDGEVYSAAEIDAAIGRAAANESELQDYRDSAYGEQWEIDVAEAEGDSDFVSALGELAYRYTQGEITAETYAYYRDETLGELASTYLEENDSGEYDEAQLSHLGAMLDRGVGIYAMQRRDEDLAEMQPELIARAADQRAIETKAVLTQWSRNQGITAPEVREQRLRAAEAAYRLEHGTEMSDLFADPSVRADQLLEVLSEYDARVATGLREVVQQDFKQRLLSEPTDLSSGLTIDGRKVIQDELPLPSEAKLSARVEAYKDRSRYTSPTQIRATFGDTPSFKDGWATKDGKPIKRISSIDGSAEQFARDELLRREQSRF